MNAELGLSPQPSILMQLLHPRLRPEALFQVCLPVPLGDRDHLFSFVLRQASGLDLDTSNCQPLSHRTPVTSAGSDGKPQPQARRRSPLVTSTAFSQPSSQAALRAPCQSSTTQTRHTVQREPSQLCMGRVCDYSRDGSNRPEFGSSFLSMHVTSVKSLDPLSSVWASVKWG